jgi:hypothetical protein
MAKPMIEKARAFLEEHRFALAGVSNERPSRALRGRAVSFAVPAPSMAAGPTDRKHGAGDAGAHDERKPATRR